MGKCVNKFDLLRKSMGERESNPKTVWPSLTSSSAIALPNCPEEPNIRVTGSNYVDLYSSHYTMHRQ